MLFVRFFSAVKIILHAYNIFTVYWQTFKSEKVLVIFNALFTESKAALV